MSRWIRTIAVLLLTATPAAFAPPETPVPLLVQMHLDETFADFQRAYDAAGNDAGKKEAAVMALYAELRQATRRVEEAMPAPAGPPNTVSAENAGRVRTADALNAALALNDGKPLTLEKVRALVAKYPSALEPEMTQERNESTAKYGDSYTPAQRRAILLSIQQRTEALRAKLYGAALPEKTGEVSLAHGALLSLNDRVETVTARLPSENKPTTVRPANPAPPVSPVQGAQGTGHTAADGDIILLDAAEPRRGEPTRGEPRRDVQAPVQAPLATAPLTTDDPNAHELASPELEAKLRELVAEWEELREIADRHGIDGPTADADATAVESMTDRSRRMMEVAAILERIRTNGGVLLPNDWRAIRGLLHPSVDTDGAIPERARTAAEVAASLQAMRDEVRRLSTELKKKPLSAAEKEAVARAEKSSRFAIKSREGRSLEIAAPSWIDRLAARWNDWRDRRAQNREESQKVRAAAAERARTAYEAQVRQRAAEAETRQRQREADRARREREKEQRRRDKEAERRRVEAQRQYDRTYGSSGGYGSTRPYDPYRPGSGGGGGKGIGCWWMLGAIAVVGGGLYWWDHSETEWKKWAGWSPDRTDTQVAVAKQSRKLWGGYEDAKTPISQELALNDVVKHMEDTPKGESHESFRHMAQMAAAELKPEKRETHSAGVRERLLRVVENGLPGAAIDLSYEQAKDSVMPKSARLRALRYWLNHERGSYYGSDGSLDRYKKRVEEMLDIALQFYRGAWSDGEKADMLELVERASSRLISDSMRYHEMGKFFWDLYRTTDSEKQKNVARDAYLMRNYISHNANGTFRSENDPIVAPLLKQFESLNQKEHEEASRLLQYNVYRWDRSEWQAMLQRALQRREKAIWDELQKKRLEDEEKLKPKPKVAPKEATPVAPKVEPKKEEVPRGEDKPGPVNPGDGGKAKPVPRGNIPGGVAKPAPKEAKPAPKAPAPPPKKK